MATRMAAVSSVEPRTEELIEGLLIIALTFLDYCKSSRFQFASMKRICSEMAKHVALDTPMVT
jgi:hypothetical protein